MSITEAKQQAGTAALEARVDRNQLPQHVAVIMDGNGRWGVNQGRSREYGHQESVEAMRAAVTCADDMGVGCLSLFCFSTENLHRPAGEVDSLFALFDHVLDTEVELLHAKNTRIIISGLVELLPEPLPAKFAQAIARTADNTGLTLNLCVMYSGRTEVLIAAKRLAEASQAGEFDLNTLDEESFRQFFFHGDLPDVDLVVRTSGERRVSNFLLWQMAYAELVFTEVLWPDFGRADFLAALLEYQARQRRFGKV